MDNNNTYEWLYASFDRELTSGQKAKLEKALAGDPELRKEKQDIQEIRSLLKNTSFRFHEGFAGRVMNRIKEEGGHVIEMDVSSQMINLFRKIAMAGVAAIVILLLSIYLTSGTLNKNSVLGVDSFSDDNLVSYLLYEDVGE
ncbi:MAG TPA: hypothetical protein ENK25_06815 [Bacteroidetes bacterium]|nr:hypothetical protein [Bacteroidota bacterium]